MPRREPPAGYLKSTSILEVYALPCGIEGVCAAADAPYAFPGNGCQGRVVDKVRKRDKPGRNFNNSVVGNIELGRIVRRKGLVARDEKPSRVPDAVADVDFRNRERRLVKRHVIVRPLGCHIRRICRWNGTVIPFSTIAPHSVNRRLPRRGVGIARNRDGSAAFDPVFAGIARRTLPHALYADFGDGNRDFRRYVQLAAHADLRHERRGAERIGGGIREAERAVHRERSEPRKRRGRRRGEVERRARRDSYRLDVFEAAACGKAHRAI